MSYQHAGIKNPIISAIQRGGRSGARASAAAAADRRHQHRQQRVDTRKLLGGVSTVSKPVLEFENRIDRLGE
jgi:hypothetical protein